MTSTAVSPFVVGDFEVVEFADARGKRKLWKKQILPAGTRNYKGKELDFSKINPAVVQAFDDNAFDAVPFVMSLTSNEHPQIGQEGELIEGDLDKLELAQDGSLYGYFDLSHSYKVLNAIRKSNGKFGVSGRVEVDYTAEDSGKHFDYALSHVCGTTRPHIKGMAGWTPVELSEKEKEREVIDFSGEVIDEPTTPTDNNDTKETGDDLVAVEIPADKLEKLLALLDDEEDGIEETADDIAAKQSQELPKEAQDRIAAAEESGRRALELAERMQVSAASERWGAQRAAYLTEGVPPAILDLAEKVLSRHRPITLQFAENDTVDASDIVSKILDECKGYITLGDERGHSFRDSKDSKQDEAYDKLEENFMAMWEHDGRGR